MEDTSETWGACKPPVMSANDLLGKVQNFKIPNNFNPVVVGLLYLQKRFVPLLKFSLIKLTPKGSNQSDSSRQISGEMRSVRMPEEKTHQRGGFLQFT